MTVRLYYLFHSGVAVETAERLLVFDYWKDGALAGGVPALARRTGKPLTVFVSHSHHDHFQPAVFDWAAALPSVTYVLSDDVPARPGCHTMGPGQTLELPGMTVSTLRSTDQGVAFVVRCEGLALYHGGDLHWWHWNGEPEADNAAMGRAYRAEIDRLAGLHLDAAFVPVDGRQEDAAFLGIDYFARTVDCPRLVPIHAAFDGRALAALPGRPGPWQGRLLLLDEAHPTAVFEA